MTRAAARPHLRNARHLPGVVVALAVSLILSGVAAVAGSPPALATTPITTSDISSAATISFTLTDQISDSDSCSFSSGPSAEHCSGFLDSPSGGNQNGTGSFAGAMDLTVPVTNADGLASPATGTGTWNETVQSSSSTVTASGVPSNLGVGFGGGSCGTISARSNEDYQGSTTPGSYQVTDLHAIIDGTGAVTDLNLHVNDSYPFPQEQTRETDTLLSSEFPDQPGCAAGTSYTVDFGGAQGYGDYSAGLPSAVRYPPQLGGGLTGWTIDPTGTWTPQTGGVLAEKRITSQTSETAPDSGTINNQYLLQVVTGSCTGAAAAVGHAASTPATAAAAGACGLVADPGGPNPVTRVGQVTLDGSHSHGAPKVPITTYQWFWTPGPDCPAGLNLTSTQSAATSSPTLTIQVLCSLNIRLVVTDQNGKTAKNDTTVTVDPRQGDFTHTDVTYTADLSGHDRRLRPTQPNIGTTSGVFSLNVDGCANGRKVPAADPAVFCPYVPIAAGKTHHNKGYTTATLNDPTGPFNGIAYVQSASLNIQRRGIFDRDILQGAPRPARAAKVDFYAKNNTAAPDTLNAFLTALNEHEGDGTGPANTGHTEIMRAVAATDDGNINKKLETMLAGTEKALQQDAEVELAADEIVIFQSSLDPNAQRIWQGTLQLWNPNTQTWTPDTCFVGGDQPGCA